MRTQNHSMLVRLVRMCIPAMAAVAMLSTAPADQSGMITFTNETPLRRFGFSLPDQPPAQPLPLVIHLHGGASTAAKSMEASSPASVWRTIADRDKAVVLFGEGTANDPLWTAVQGYFWNDCRAYRGYPTSDEDDIAYLRRLIDWAVNESGQSIDTNRIYITGASNGGLMTFRAAREMSADLAGIATFIANLEEDPGCGTPANPIPVFLCNGTSDAFMPYAGGAVTSVTLGVRGDVVSTDETFAYWQRVNGTQGQPTVTDIPNSVIGDNSTVSVIRYGGGREGAEVALYRVNGGNHSIPSILHQNGGNRQNHDIEGIEEAWAFLRRFTRQGLTPSPNAVPVPADYDGDGLDDFATFDPDTGVWTIAGSLNSDQRQIPFGFPGCVPVPGDYDGDGLDDIAVFYPGVISNPNGQPTEGNWFIYQSRDGFRYEQFGWNRPRPVPADYDGDGKTDLGLYDPPTGLWYLFRSRLGFTTVQFGWNGPTPVPADYDGDGRDDIALYYGPMINQPAQGLWYLLQSTGGFAVRQFGWDAGPGGPFPVPGDYDGDGAANLGLYYADGLQIGGRYSEGNWFIALPGRATLIESFGWREALGVPGIYQGSRARLGVYHPASGNWWHRLP